MNEIKSFTFYKNYYDLLDNLPVEDKRLMLEVIVDYIFRDVEPIGLVKMNLAIWNNIKMPLDTSKKNSLRSLGNGAPVGNKNASKKQTKNKPKTNQTGNQKQTNNISNFYFLISNNNFLKDRGLLRGKIEEWLKYKWERKEYYKETGFKTLLARIESATSQYGVEEIISLIDECMANNYKGIIFEKLKGKKVEKVPDWFNQTTSAEIATVEEQKEMENLLSKYRGE